MSEVPLYCRGLAGGASLRGGDMHATFHSKLCIHKHPPPLPYADVSEGSCISPPPIFLKFLYSASLVEG